MSSLSAAAPTLRTLCVVSRGSCDFLLRPHPCEFLLLEELSWMGAHSPLLLDPPGADADSVGTAGRAVYPVFERVHCIVENAAYAERVVAKLTALAALSLTHLCVSALDHHASDVPDVLERVMGVRARQVFGHAVGERLGEEEWRVPRLRRIIIHSAAPPQDGANEDIDGAWAELSTRIASVVDACNGGGEGIRGLYLERPFQRNPRWHERLRNDWTVRIEGRKGCWVESEEDESALETCEDDP